MIEKKAENIEYCEESWLDIVEKQEEILRFETFSRQDAMELGNLICRMAEEKYKEDVAVKIVMDGLAVFSCFMGKTGLKNDWWMSCKYNTVLQTGTSSLKALLLHVAGKKKFGQWYEQKNSYYLCGGAFPLRTKEGRIFGCVLVSGLTHEKDHQLIVDALSETLHAELVSVI